MELLIIGVIILLAAFVQGLSGFGFAIIAMPLLLFYFDIKFTIPLVAVVALVLIALITFRLRKHIDKKKIFPLVAGAILGAPFGVFFLKTLDERIIELALGLFIVFYALYSLFARIKPTGIKDVWGYFAGFVAGGTAGAFNIGGPPVVTYLTMKKWNKDQIKSTMQGFFLFNTVYRIILYASVNLITGKVLLYSLYLIPFVIIGEKIGSIFYHKIDHLFFRSVVLVLLLILGVLLVIKAL